MHGQETERNVLFVVLDTVRKDRLSVYGYDRPTTPNLSAFAEEATVFEQAVAPAPWTLPVHASMFTGLYPGEHGASQGRPYLQGTTTLAEVLAARGYDTACYSANAWITPYTGLTAGFAHQDNFFEIMPGDLGSGPLARLWRGMNDNDRLRAVANWLVHVGNEVHERLAAGSGADSKTPAAIDRTIEFVEGTDGPFFAFLNLMDAHLPYHPPEEYREEFAPGVDPTTVCQNSKEYNSGAREIDDEEWAAIRGLYDAELAHLDAEVGRLLDWLASSGRAEETTVVICADHGELHGEHGLYGHEFCLYDELVNVPLLIADPAIDDGRRADQVELLDLYHTILDVSGADDVETVSDSATAFDPRRSLRRDGYRAFDESAFAFVEYDRPVVELDQLERKASAAGIELDRESRFYSRMRAVRRADAKYVQNERIPDEFYRLDRDPAETTSRLSDGNGREAELREALSRFEERVGEWPTDVGLSPSNGSDAVEEMDDATKDRLRRLGYLE